MSTIKKVKDSYTQEEVDRLLDEQASKTTAEMLEKFKGYKSKDEIKKIVWLSRIFFNENQFISFSNLRNSFNKWIEENL